MKKIIVFESQINAVIKKIISEQHLNDQLNEIKSDVYKPEWTENDTILSLYVAKYDIFDFPEFRVGKRSDAYKELANRVIGSTGNSLLRQTLNILWLLGEDNNQSDVSDLQKRVVDKYGTMPKEELKKICQEIINNNIDGNDYQRFLQKQKEIKGTQAKKEMEIKKEKSKIDLDNFWRLSGRDPSKMKSLGHRATE